MAFFNFKNLKNNNDQLFWFLFDVIMVTLAIININLILFDFLFSYNLAINFFASFAPRLTDWYNQNIHQNFIFIDLAFVAIFIIEFIFRWIIAIYNKEYKKWFLFPFARWYDVLGLIPIGSFRFLRILRIVSIITRLQKMKVIDVRESSFYPYLNNIYNIAVEEISDRVVINVLNGVKDEMDDGDDITHEIVTKVIKPNNEKMVNFALEKVQVITQQILQNNQEDIKEYLFDKVNNAVNDNNEMKMIKAVPGLGGIIRKQLDHAIADITYKVIAGIVDDVANGEDVFTKEINEISIQVLESLENDIELENIVKSLSFETIEILKNQVAKKKWQGN